jgi:Tol biopolymer transport system component
VIGQRFAAYQVVAKLGEGGMGEVYRARDSRLHRDVALKILPDTFASDPDRLARFEREAQVLASLNHPHIAHIYGLEESGTTRGLVMELVEGETLADRIARSPVPLDEALAMARQIADALAAAHDQGIVHRDLKPANIKVREDGTVKVLDFGLAKALDPAGSAGGGGSMAPTITSPAMTRAGIILGTAAYMAPEQARGKPVDRRADIWAFGCVLYEMLTGRRAFDAEDMSLTLSMVLQREPDFAALPGGVPSNITQTLRVCLRKDPRERASDIRDVRLALEGAFSGETAAVAATGRRAGGVIAKALAAAALVLAAAMGYGWWRAARPVEPAAGLPHLEFALALPDGWTFAGSVPRFSLSPDGTRLVFNAVRSGRTQMWVRRLDSTELVPVPGTDSSNTPPFWSSDSRYFALFQDGKLKRFDAGNLSSQVLSDAGLTDTGGSWSPDGQIILFSGRTPTTGVQRIPASGGVPTPVFKSRSAGATQLWPRFLPDGQHFVYLSLGNEGRKDGIYVASLDGSDPEWLVETESHAEYAGGYLFYRSQGALVARPFDAARRAFTGDSVQVSSRVSVLGTNGRAAFSVTANGLLVYAASALSNADFQLTWMDRAGKAVGKAGDAGNYGQIVLSPDNRKLAFTVSSEANPTSGKVWVMDLTRSISSRATSSPSDSAAPVWSPDGRTLAYLSSSGQGSGIYTLLVSGLEQERLLYPLERVGFPQDWSGDGRFLLTAGAGGFDAIPTQKGGTPVPLQRSNYMEVQPRFSPDGRWIAYVSDESGRPQVYVRSFPGQEFKVQVSADGGYQPSWSPDGKELFYLALDSTLMAVPVRSGGPFELGDAAPLFLTQIVPWGAGPQRRDYAVSNDGARFLVNLPVTVAGRVPVTIVQNWRALLK